MASIPYEADCVSQQVCTTGMRPMVYILTVNLMRWDEMLCATIATCSEHAVSLQEHGMFVNVIIKPQDLHSKSHLDSGRSVAMGKYYAGHCPLAEAHFPYIRGI